MDKKVILTLITDKVHGTIYCDVEFRSHCPILLCIRFGLIAVFSELPSKTLCSSTKALMHHPADPPQLCPVHYCRCQHFPGSENKQSAAKPTRVSADTNSLCCQAINPYQGHREHENLVRWISALRHSQCSYPIIANGGSKLTQRSILVHVMCACECVCDWGDIGVGGVTVYGWNQRIIYHCVTLISLHPMGPCSALCTNGSV